MIKSVLQKFKPKHPKPWKQFLLKAAGVSAVTSVVAILGFSAFSQRFEILIDPQVMKCLPDYTVYLVDRHNRTPIRGKPFAFKAAGIDVHLQVDDKRLDPIRRYYRNGAKLLKIMDGLPGDSLTITENTIKVNGAATGVAGLLLSRTLQKPPSMYERHEVIPPDHYFFAGRTFDSFDSRYWGNVNGDQIIGRAYPLF